MVLAIVRKELRETRAFAALAIGLFFIYVIKLTGNLSPLLTSLLGWALGYERGTARCSVRPG